MSTLFQEIAFAMTGRNIDAARERIFLSSPFPQLCNNLIISGEASRLVL